MRSVVALCIALFLIPAFAGEPAGEACYDLYAGGAKVEPDFAQAYRCFAADKNWLMMAFMQARGEGVPKDLARAKATLAEWIERGGPVSHPLLGFSAHLPSGGGNGRDAVRPEDMMRILTVIFYGQCPAGMKICEWGESDDRIRSEYEGRKIRLDVDVRKVADVLDSAKPLNYCSPFYEPPSDRFMGPNWLNYICGFESSERERYARSRRLAKVMAGLSPRPQALLKELVAAHQRLVVAEQHLTYLATGPAQVTSAVYSQDEARRETEARLDEIFSESLWLAIHEKKLRSVDPSASRAADEALAVLLERRTEEARSDYRERAELFCPGDSAEPGQVSECFITPVEGDKALAERQLAWLSYRDAFVRLAVDVYGETPIDWDPALSMRALLARGYPRFLGGP